MAQCEILDLLSLNNIKRWTTVDTLRIQTVAEHTFNVLVYSLAIAKEIEIRYDKTIDFQALAMTILYHDSNEIITGDLPSDTKEEIYPMEIVPCIIKIADTIEALIFIKRYGVKSEEVEEFLTRKLNRYVKHLTAFLGDPTTPTINSLDDAIHCSIINHKRTRE